MMALDNNPKPVPATNESSTDDVLRSLARLLAEERTAIIEANKTDVAACPPDDIVIYDRLKVDDAKVDRMIASVEQVIALPSAVGTVISTHTRPNGLRVENRRVPFGTILIIFEARPDVCIEAAMIAAGTTLKLSTIPTMAEPGCTTTWLPTDSR